MGDAVLMVAMAECMATVGVISIGEDGDGMATPPGFLRNGHLNDGLTLPI